MPVGSCAWVVVIAGAAGLFIVSVNCADEADLGPAVLESITVRVNRTVDLLVGVPEIAPVLELIESPSAGSPEALQVSVPEPPVAAAAKL